jgi:hypothetical protein
MTDNPTPNTPHHTFFDEPENPNYCTTLSQTDITAFIANLGSPVGPIQPSEFAKTLKITPADESALRKLIVHYGTQAIRHHIGLPKDAPVHMKAMNEAFTAIFAWILTRASTEEAAARQEWTPEMSGNLLSLADRYFEARNAYFDTLRNNDDALYAAMKTSERALVDYVRTLVEGGAK